MTERGHRLTHPLPHLVTIAAIAAIAAITARARTSA